jgi:solute carrier family 9B (sodium/hydrogen exchanger), member 1/2
MLLSLALILLVGSTLSGIFIKLKLPGLLGMILTGILLGPFTLNLITPEILTLSPDLREIALVVILLRAGLSIDLNDLRKVGRPALLMCFVPATFEIVAVTLLAPQLFAISYLDAAIMGTVLAAVSPAVIVPRMIHLIDLHYGKKNSIPQLIMAGASVDDIYIIVLFTSFMTMAKGGAFNLISLLSLPISIGLGLILGYFTGLLLVRLFKWLHLRDTSKVLLIISTSFLLITVETMVKPFLPISSLLAIMALGAAILKNYEFLALRLKGKFSKIWVGAEILLFVLVGASLDISYIPKVGFNAFILISVALAIRVLGVNLSLLKTALTIKERLFCSIAYLPKATVQAAIGSIPMAAGLSSGNLILTIAVAAIVITAPLGAIGIDRTYKRLLDKD